MRAGVTRNFLGLMLSYFSGFVGAFVISVSAQSNSSRSTDVGATTYDPSLLETRSTSTRPSLQEETTRPPDPQKTIPAETPTAELNLVQTSSKQSHAASTTAATFSSSTAKDVEIGLDKFLANRVSYSDTRPLDFLSLLENGKGFQEHFVNFELRPICDSK